MTFVVLVVIVWIALCIGVIVLEREGRRNLDRARKDLKGPEDRERVGL